MTTPTEPTPLRLSRIRCPVSRTVVAWAASLLLLVVAQGARGQETDLPATVPEGHPARERDVGALLDDVFDQLRGGPRRATLELVVERDGRRDTFVLDVVSDGADRSLIRVLEPQRDAGQGFLVLGSDLLTYLPRVGRVLRLPPSGRSDGFLGSDISFDDLAGEGLIADAEVALAAATDDTVTLRLVPSRNAPTPYGAVRLTARWPDLVPTTLAYEDQRGNDVRRMVLADVMETADGRSVPTRFVVEDLTGSGSTTIATWTIRETSGPLPDACFEPLALERGCSW
jgi:hypothetical protein